MFRKGINQILLLPLALCINPHSVLLSENINYIDSVLDEKENKIFVNYKEIEEIILNNPELKSLQELVTSASFNLSSKISQKYPSLDLQVSGLPKYIASKNYNSNSPTTKTSQFSANPSLNIRWDIIDPLVGSEIKIAKNSLKIAKNNYEIKRRDLIQEAKLDFHNYQKSYMEIKNKKYARDLSITSLNNAKAKLEAGIGTKFEILEAEAQLARDIQSLNEKKIEHQINKISLKEILNITDNLDINFQQKLVGFWNYKLNKNIKNGLAKNISLKNISLQKEIKENQANSFLNASKPKIYISNTLSGNFTKGDSSSSEINPSKSSSTYTNTISLNLSWNIFNSGQNKNSYKSSEAEINSEGYSLIKFQNVLKTNISKAYLNLKLNEEKIMSSLKEISSTSESLRLSRLRYDVGISTLKDVLTRQKELSNAKTKNINAIYNYNLNLDELERLTFLDIDTECIEKNINKINKEESFCNFSR